MHARIAIFISVIILHGFLLKLCAQTETASTDTSFHNPRRAALYSAVLPGLGQAYNKKYWKIPVVYAAFGVIGYFYVDNISNYKTYKEAYMFRTDDNPDTFDDYVDLYTDENLKVLRDYYRRNSELTVIIGAAVYLINIIDATVDAHLFDFEVNDDLSLKISPDFFPSVSGIPGYGSLRFTLKF